MELTIKQRYSRIKSRLHKARKDLHNLQERCPHKDKNSRIVDGVEVHFDCSECGKRWTYALTLGC